MQSKLLINDYNCALNLKDKVINNIYSPLDTNMPTTRFRGNFFKVLDDGTLCIIGWQRNFARLDRVDLSLPTIITIVLDKDKKISSVELDSSFKGSKGLLCSRKYLNKNLQKLVGKKLDLLLIKKIKVETMFCYHIVEVITGMYGYYQMIQDEIERTADKDDCYYEEESVDMYCDENGSMYFSGCHSIKNIEPIHYCVKFNNLLKKIGFDKNGRMTKADNLICEFYLNNKLNFTQTITISKSDKYYSVLQKFMFKCIKNLKSIITTDEKLKLYNTNLYPVAFIGLFVQTSAIKIFRHNYQYIMYILTALQRNEHGPICIGAIKNHEEAERHFQGFDLNDLL